MSQIPEVCRVSDVAERIDVPASTLYDWARDGKIPVVRTATGWLFTRDMVRHLSASLHNYGRDAVNSGFCLHKFNNK